MRGAPDTDFAGEKGRGQVNNKLCSEVLTHGKDLNGSKLAVMLILVYYSDEDRVCWPRVGKLVKHSHLKRRQVQYILEELIKLGYVIVERIGTAHKPPLYRLSVPGLPDVEN
ncbi:MAG TPA: helix-turn-helix domain-containing protein [Chloroflexia bacterium]|nr:helix-turn-helix domain-containing protein [Chloroflexia bacterium]